MTITLEVGRYYKDRIGRVWGPMGYNEVADTDLKFYCRTKGKEWRADGMFFSDRRCRLDLIEEVPGPQSEPALGSPMHGEVTVARGDLFDIARLCQLVAGPCDARNTADRIMAEITGNDPRYKSEAGPQPAFGPAPRLARDMTLREHIAGLALAALIVDPNSGGDIVKHAVKHADALIAALDKEKSK